MIDGRFEGNVHVLPIRVYYEDTDLSGVVYHANYLRFMERGRSEFFRAVNIPLAYLNEAEPAAWTLRKVTVEFIRPARLEDVVEVRTVPATLTGVRLSADQSVYCGDVLLMKGWVEACIMTTAGKPRRIPRDVRDKLLPFLGKTEA
ncbi:MAG: YbgC/FadM family acyl-CoA thioesterase [Alphaproteobacteria bacterium]|nr:YbgC/FadM family acyl-CoA thioesterase [Alphaproteobacteria bacterium]